MEYFYICLAVWFLTPIVAYPVIFVTFRLYLKEHEFDSYMTRLLVASNARDDWVATWIPIFGQILLIVCIFRFLCCILNKLYKLFLKISDKLFGL